MSASEERTVEHAGLERQLDRLHQLLLVSIVVHSALFAVAAVTAADGFFLRWLLLIPAAGVLVGLVGAVAGRAYAGVVGRSHDGRDGAGWSDPTRLPERLGVALTVVWVVVAVLMVGSLEWW